MLSGLLSIQAEPTLSTSPLAFRRMPPQQNYPPCTVFYPDKGLELDSKKLL